jgi:hypothetical protein
VTGSCQDLKDAAEAGRVFGSRGQTTIEQAPCRSELRKLISIVGCSAIFEKEYVAA